MPDELIQHESALPSISLEQLVVTMAQSPDMTTQKVEVMERLMAMMERREEQRRKEQFYAALARVQAKVPRIAQNGMMDRGNGGKIPYAKREDIDAMVRPIYLEEGFSVTWDAPVSSEGKIQVKGSFSCCGHTEVREITFAPDPSGGKTGPQATSSSVAYGKRQIEKMFWNIIEEGADKNGTAEKALISQDQADDIRTRMNDLPQSAAGNLLSKLCRKYSVERPEQLAGTLYPAVIADVEATERQKR